jgi:hypothetical protein
LANEKALALRLRKPKDKYLIKNFLTNNPNITTLKKKFESLTGARELKHKTMRHRKAKQYLVRRQQ